MFPRIAVVILLAIVVGFGVAKVFEQGTNPQAASQSGAQLDAALNNAQGDVATARWYDNPSTIGLVAGGAVFVVGVVVVASLKPKVPEDGTRRR